jgi:hypothetical protein
MSAKRQISRNGWTLGAALLAGVGLTWTTARADAPTSNAGLDYLARMAVLPDLPLRPDQFAAVHRAIKPQLGESRWVQIPWMTSLWDARRKAAAEGKPLFIWLITDGHPCGFC